MRRLLLFFILLLFIPKLSLSYDLTDIQNLMSPRTDKTISMDFKDALLADVLKIFSQQSGLNFIAASDISNKKINLYLDQVPVEEALERILSANSLTYELKPESNIFLVKSLVKSTKDLMTRIYPLKYASVSSSKINSTLGASSSSTGSSASGSSSGSAESSASSGGGSSGIMESIKAVLSSDGSIVEDSRTNSLIITDIPSQFPSIEQVLTRLDVRIPQIMIEVEMLDISKGTADLLGVKFGNEILNASGSSKKTMFPFNSSNGFLTDGKTEVSDDQATKGPNLPGSDSITSQYTLGSVSFSNLRLTMQFLTSQTDTKSLARPRILTLNNETAEIRIETQEAIQVDSTTDAETNQTTTTVTRSNTGVTLRVTPQANLLTNEITLAVEPTVTEAKTSNLISSGVQIKDPETRGSKSMLRIKNGDTAIIGGLLRTDSSDTRTSVPGISHVPIIGAAFRHKDKSEKQRELIIFITPHIVNDQAEPTELTSNANNLEREQSTSSK